MLRGAIIGFGEVARNGHWPAYQACPDVEVVAVVDRAAERRQLASSLSPSIATFSSIDDLVRNASVDFVDICTPPALHAEPMLAAVAKGWHVLCEKPFLLDPAIVETVRTRARRAGVAVVPVDNWKYAPIVRAATAALREGAIGRLRRVEIRVSRLRAAPTADVGRPNWRRDPAMAGGGILMDHGWHAVYLALHWFAQPSAGVAGSLHHPADDSVEDEADVTIGFPDGEASIALTWNGTTRSNTMRLVGDAGQIVLADDTLHVEGLRPARVTFPQALSAGSHHDDWFAAMLPDVLRSFHHPPSSEALFEEAAECLSIIGRAYDVTRQARLLDV